MALLFGEELGGVAALFVLVDDDMLWGGYEAVLYAAIAAYRFLVGSGVEESDVERLFGV